MSEAAYHLQVVRMGEDPTWPVPAEELVVGNQPIGRGFIQYWAYPQQSGKNARDLPSAEILASENPTPKPVIIVDEEGGLLELILVADGHAWGKTESNLVNLEENLTSILDFAKEKFNMSVEHFMTTDRVNPQAEKKLDQLESEEVGQPAPTPTVPPPSASAADSAPGESVPHRTFNKPTFRPEMSGRQNFAVSGGSSGGSKLWIVLSLIVIVGMFATVVIFKDKILAKISPQPPAKVEVSPTPSPSPIPSPTPIAIERGNYKIRVLNGTKQSGAAATLGDELKGKGWLISSLGNATDSATARTQVRVKKGLTDVAAALIADLAPNLDATISADLKSTDKADAEVVIGKE